MIHWVRLRHSITKEGIEVDFSDEDQRCKDKTIGLIGGDKFHDDLNQTTLGYAQSSQVVFIVEQTKLGRVNYVSDGCSKAE